jgi:hypothetical protein
MMAQWHTLAQPKRVSPRTPGELGSIWAAALHGCMAPYPITTLLVLIGYMGVSESQIEKDAAMIYKVFGAANAKTGVPNGCAGNGVSHGPSETLRAKRTRGCYDLASSSRRSEGQPMTTA